MKYKCVLTLESKSKNDLKLNSYFEYVWFVVGGTNIFTLIKHRYPIPIRY